MQSSKCLLAHNLSFPINMEEEEEKGKEEYFIFFFWGVGGGRGWRGSWNGKKRGSGWQERYLYGRYMKLFFLDFVS